MTRAFHPQIWLTLSSVPFIIRSCSIISVQIKLMPILWWHSTLMKTALVIFLKSDSEAVSFWSDYVNACSMFPLKMSGDSRGGKFKLQQVRRKMQFPETVVRMKRFYWECILGYLQKVIDFSPKQQELIKLLLKVWKSIIIKEVLK